MYYFLEYSKTRDGCIDVSMDFSVVSQLNLLNNSLVLPEPKNIRVDGYTVTVWFPA